MLLVVTVKGNPVALWQKILALMAFAAAARHVFVAPENHPSTSSSVTNHVVQRPQIPPVDDSGPMHAVDIRIPAGTAVMLTSLSLTGNREPVVLTWQNARSDGELSPDFRHDIQVPPGWQAPEHRRLPQPRLQNANSVTWADPEPLHKADDQTPAAENAHSLLPADPRQRRFVVPFFTGQLVHDRYVVATEIAKGTRVSVYLVEGDTAAFVPRDSRPGDFNSDLPVASVMHAHEAAADLAAEIINRCEQRLLPFVERRLGPIHDLDDDGNLTIVLAQLSVNGPDHPIEPPITGCVRPSDYLFDSFQHSDAAGGDWAELSNGHGGSDGGDIVYLDCLLPGGREMDAVLAHELAHAATFCLLNDAGAADGELPGWLNEAIAHAIEQQVHPHSQNLAQRLGDFRARPHLFPVVIPNGSNHLSLRRGPARAAGCLFLNAVLQDLPEHSLRRIVQAGRSGVERLEQVSERPFSELLRDWGLQRMAGAASYPEFPLNDQHPVQLLLAGTAIAWTGAAPADGVLRVQASAAARLQITIVDLTMSRDLTPDVESVATGNAMPSVEFQ